MRRHGIIHLAFALTFIFALTSAASAQNISFSYQLDEPGRVSAGVYNAEGHLLRTLLTGEQQNAGRHTLTWDGLDREGNPQPPGNYEWRVLRTPGFKAEYITSLGINPGTERYDQWVGNHGGTASVAADDTGIYAAAQVTETAPVLLKQSFDGSERIWTRGRGDVTYGRFQGGAKLAADGQGTLYMLQQNGYVQVIDTETGRPRARWDVLEPHKERGMFIYQHDGEVAGADLDARGETVVASFRESSEVHWLNPEDGSITAKVKVDDPSAVAVGPDGRVFVVASGSLLELTPQGGKRVIVDGTLTPTARLAYEPVAQLLLVAERAPSHQIKHFSLDGALLAVYGRAGGRLDGRYQPYDFLDVSNIAADGRGGFLVAEVNAAPRRVAHFDRNGELIQEWYGGQPYYAWGEPDPVDPTKVWFNPGSWLTLAEVDYETGKWRVLENYLQSRLADGLVSTVTGHNGRWRALSHEGRRYLVSEQNTQVLIHDDGGLRPFMVVGRNVERAAEIAGRGEDARSFRWVDLNGDGIPQPEEFTFSDSASIPNGRAVAANFEVLGVFSTTREGQAYYGVTSTKPLWTEHGPIYPIGDEPGVNVVAAEVTVPSNVGTGGTRGVGAFSDSDGNYYAHYLTNDDRHGTSWPAEWGAQARLVKWDAAGNEQWRVGRHAVNGGFSAPHITKPGQMHVPAAIIGEVRDTIVMVDRVEWMGKVWTKDGLYVGDFLDGRVDDGLPDTVYYWWRSPDGVESIVTSDNATGGGLADAGDGTVIWTTQGRNGVPTYKIHGWDGWTRLNGSILLTRQAPHAKGEGTGLVARYYGRQQIEGRPVATQIDRRVWHGSPRRTPGHHEIIDGFANGPTYNWSGGVEHIADTTEGFAVRWSGQIEAILTEPFTFSVYARGGVRLWIDGRQIIYSWNEGGLRREAQPVALQAGRRYNVQLDFFSTHQHPSCSLNWESPSIDRQRIPQAYLYPERVADVPVQASTRAAGQRIDAQTFDDQSGQVDSGHMRGNTVSGLRQRGLGVSGSWLKYERLDFGEGKSKLTTRGWGNAAGNATFPVTLEFRSGSLEGPVIAVIELSNDEYRREQVAEIETLRGLQDIYVVNTTQRSWHFINLAWFQFE